MSATDTKETPRTNLLTLKFIQCDASDRLQAKKLVEHSEQLERELADADRRAGDRWKQYDAERQNHNITKKDLTAVTAQRDRALGLLKAMEVHIESICPDGCPDCGHTGGYHGEGCGWKGLLAEYEALRKGET